MEQIQEPIEPSRPLTEEITALGQLAISDTQPGIDATDYEVAHQSEEQERKRIFDANIKKLTNRFGEEFVKGQRQEAGQYMDNGARSLLSKYLSIPGFAEKIKQIIPNRYDALKTLQDNSNYIAAILAIAYENEEQFEKDEPPRDPYELAKNAGYELTGPFEHVAEFAKYEADFRKGERICTYNYPEERLRAYHMLWLRAVDADQTMPANELNESNLSESWKKYLRTIGRYNAESDTYNLNGLAPSRQDPYGTSSMSVQISREKHKKQVSIKNRYNHTVTSPDTTFESNLDNVAYGLRRAVYHKVGREDLMEAPDCSIGEGYIADNEGGIHPYFYESDNIYFGYYEYIENGAVSTIDRGKYDMISPDLYVSKRGDREVMNIARKQEQTALEVFDDTTRRLSIFDESGALEQFYDYTYDDHQGLATLTLTIAEGGKIDSVNNPVLIQLIVAEDADVSYVGYCEALSSITTAKGARIGSLFANPALTELALSEGTVIENINDNPALNDFVIPERAMIGSVCHNPALASLTISQYAKVRSIFANDALSNLTIAEGAEAGDISFNPSLMELSIPKDAYIGIVVRNDSLSEVIIDEGARVGDIIDNHPFVYIRRGIR